MSTYYKNIIREHKRNRRSKEEQVLDISRRIRVAMGLTPKDLEYAVSNQIWFGTKAMLYCLVATKVCMESGWYDIIWPDQYLKPGTGAPDPLSEKVINDIINSLHS